MKIFLQALVPLALIAMVQGFSISNCAMTPKNDEDNPVPERETVSLDCSFDSTVETCVWVHDEPLNVGTHTSGTFDIKCSAGPGENGQNCKSLSRVQYSFQDNRCGIRISGTEPEDTGKWKLSAVGLSSSGSGVQTATRDFELFTFNQSTLAMIDEDENELMGDTYEVDYNFNDRQNDWEEGKSNWETVTLMCVAYGGRPEPTFKWYIDNNDNNDLSSESHFRISPNLHSVDDKDEYIRNLESKIEFQVDEKLMEILEQNNVETNNEDGRVSFRLTCEIEQGTNSFVDSGYINIDINKSYDNGILPASTIGMIVGIVLGVLVLVIVAALVLFAKASNTLCFSDGRGRHEPVGPKPPSQGKSRGHGGGPPGPANYGRKQQVHSDPIIKQDPSGSMTKSIWETTKSSPHPSLASKKSPKMKPRSKVSDYPSDGSNNLASLPRSSPPDYSRSDNSVDTPPPRPDKPSSLNYANLDHRPFMNDPRNQVLPQSSLYRREPQTPTNYASIQKVSTKSHSSYTTSSNNFL